MAQKDLIESIIQTLNPGLKVKNLKLLPPLGKRLDEVISSLNYAETAKEIVRIRATHYNQSKDFYYCFVPFVSDDGTIVVDGVEYTPELLLVFAKEVTDKETAREQLHRRDLKDYILYRVDVLKEIKEEISKELNKNVSPSELIQKSENGILYLDRFLERFIQRFIFRKKLFSIVDFTNPLARLESLRRVRFFDVLPKKGKSFEEFLKNIFLTSSGYRPLSGRNPDPTHIGRLCIVETPESERIGQVLHLASEALIEDRTIYTPLYNSLENKVEYFSPHNEPEFIYERAKKSYLVKRNRRYEGENTVSLIELKEEGAKEDNFSLSSDSSIFGYAALQIPFINRNDPARALMGAKNLKQALPVEESEPPLVKTGFEDKIFTDSLSIIRAKTDGIVREIKGDRIVIFDGEREIEHPILKDYHSVLTNVAVNHKSSVSLGQKVKKGDPLAYLDGIKDGALALGVNLLVAYMPFKGLNMDDAIVISESAAKKLTSTHIFRHEVTIPEFAIVEEDESALKENQTAKERDILICFKTPARTDSALFEYIKLIDEDIKNETLRRFREEYQLSYKSFDDLISDRDLLRKIRNLIIEEKIFNPTLKKIIDKLKPEKTYATNIKILHYLFPELIDFDRVKIRVPSEYVCSFFVRKKIEADRVIFWFKKTCPLSVGDKLMGRHGNKGVISKILPDSEMPHFCINQKKYTVDIILNPLGVISRMNIGQLLETHFGFIGIHHPDQKVREFAQNSGKPFGEVDFEMLGKWLTESGLDSSGKIRLCLSCNGDCESAKKTENPVTVGYQYFLKLNHVAKLKLSARGDNGKRSIKTGMPLRGGHHSGQRLGEMETWALIAHGELDLLRELFTWRANLFPGESHTRSLQAFRDYLKGLGVDFQVLDEQRKYKFKFNRDINDYGRIFRGSFGEIWNQIATSKELLDSIFHVNLPDSLKSEILNKTLDFIPLVPQRLRPLPFDRLNRLYAKATKLAQRYSQTKKDSEKDKIREALTEIAEKIERTIINSIKGKGGIIRGAILGRRITRSGRAVIVPDPELPPYQISIPWKIAKALGLSSTGEDLVLLNRQPTLHPHNIQVFSYTINNDSVIKINPLICKAYNADFDGDTMSVFAVDKKLIKHNSIYAENQLFSSALSSVLLNISQDILMGLYLLNHSERESLIRACFPDCPEELYKERFTAQSIDSLIELFYLRNQRDFKKTVDFINCLSKAALDVVTNYGLTLSYRDFLEFSMSEADKQRLISSTSPEQWDSLISNSLKNKSKSLSNNPITLMLSSRARGSWDNLRQIAVSRGTVEMTDTNGKTVKHPVWIRSSYLEGLSPFEYFVAVYGARKALADKKLMTPHCGYFTRRLVYMAADLVIKEHDCGTEDYIEIEGKHSFGRFALIDEGGKPEIVDEEKYKLLKGVDKVKVRSPLKCKVKGGICQVCYGWELSQRKLPHIGFHVGVLAATVVGERATQDAMKTFHTAKATETLSRFDETVRIFEKLERVSIDDVESLIDKLSRDIYENKVDRKHFEILIRALLRELFEEQKKELKASTKTVAHKVGNPLHSIAFENPIATIKKAAEKEEIYEPKTIFEEIFLL